MRRLICSFTIHNCSNTPFRATKQGIYEGSRINCFYIGEDSEAPTSVQSDKDLYRPFIKEQLYPVGIIADI